MRRCKSEFFEQYFTIPVEVQDEYKRCQLEIKDILQEKELDSELKQWGNLAFDFIEW